MEISSIETAEMPAARAIRLLKAKRIAAACDLDSSAVLKWVTRGAGLIPSRYQRRVLQLARSYGVDLTAEHIVGLAA